MLSFVQLRHVAHGVMVADAKDVDDRFRVALKFRLVNRVGPVDGLLGPRHRRRDKNVFDAGHVFRQHAGVASQARVAGLDLEVDRLAAALDDGFLVHDLRADVLRQIKSDVGDLVTLEERKGRDDQIVKVGRSERGGHCCLLRGELSALGSDL